MTPTPAACVAAFALMASAANASAQDSPAPQPRNAEIRRICEIVLRVPLNGAEGEACMSGLSWFDTAPPTRAPPRVKDGARKSYVDASSEERFRREILACSLIESAGQRPGSGDCVASLAAGLAAADMPPN